MPKKATRLTGHGLAHEGWAYTSRGPRRGSGTRAPVENAAGPGMALCECGTFSPMLPNRARRKAWHADHKDDIRAGGTGVVWENGYQP